MDLSLVLSDLRELVECESPSSDLAAVSRSADLVARIGAARLGVAPEHLVVDGCTHLRWRLGTGPSRVLVLGHHDTVWPLGSLATHPWSAEGGVVRGPGCFDMKAGLVMAFHALADLDDRDGVTLLVTGDEEIGSPTSRALIEEEAREASVALVLEASADGGALKIER
jgi:glutamate carboxypeptidase